MMTWQAETDVARLIAPAAERNKDAIRDGLVALFADPSSRDGCLLEVGSGTGQHAVHCSPALAPLTWLPSDPDPTHRASIDAWRRDASDGRVAAPLALDATAATWPLPEEFGPLRAVFSANMIHIAPWSACTGLVAGASQYLTPGGRLILYGPFKRNGVHTADSNAAFDRGLRDQDPAWGVRDLDDVTALTQDAGFGAPDAIDMPANNLIVVFSRS